MQPTKKRSFSKEQEGRLFQDDSIFHNTAEFYSLFMIVWKMRKEKLVLGDRKRNEAAMAMLRKLGAGVDELRDQLRKAQPAKANQRMFADYLLTVQGDTDSAATRKRRAEVLEPMLFPLFERGGQAALFIKTWILESGRAALLCWQELPNPEEGPRLGKMSQSTMFWRG